MSLRRTTAALGAALLLTLTAACSSNEASSSTSGGDSASAPGKDSAKVGFIFVGPKDDYGYNQAAYEGSQAVAKAHPDLKVVTAENVPEDDNAYRVMEGMIERGAHQSIAGKNRRLV